MVDVQTVSVMLASASVIAGVIYCALQLRHQTKIRSRLSLEKKPRKHRSCLDLLGEAFISVWEGNIDFLRMSKWL